MSPQPAHRVGAHRAKRKEAFYVRVGLPDGTSQFFPATDYIGKEMPFDKPKETCAMRVYPDVVTFSLLHLTKRTSADLKAKPIEMPHGPLARLARRAKAIEGLGLGHVVVEHEENQYRLTLNKDENNVARLELEGDETVFELGRRGERISLYFVSPGVGRLIAISFIGHLGRPGGPETITRCAAKIINAAVALPEFQLLADIETAVVPALPGSRPVSRIQVDPVTVELPVKMFTEAFEPVGAGTVAIEVDLEHANASTERLLFTLHPSDKIAEHFEAYRGICDRAIAAQLPMVLGDELKGVIFDIVLGEVAAGTTDRLREALETLPGFDLTPTQCRPFDREPASA